jgi:hypothetical protein
MKTIMDMAREVGIEEAFSLKQDQYLVRFKDDSLERFAALVAAAEREACAKVCEEMRTYVGRNNAVTQSSAQDCATAIRARGQA